MIPGIIDKVKKDINERGHSQRDNRLDRNTRALNGYQLIHHFIEEVGKMPVLKQKYQADWERIYPTYVKRCELLEADPLTRRAVIFNTSKYYEIFPCFLTMHVILNEHNEYDMIVYQRSSDLIKLEDDIEFFEHVMYKISHRVGIKVRRLIINYGSIHYQTTE
jgi:hypothetical protein